MIGPIETARTYPISVKGVLLSPLHEVVLLLNEREQWELPGGRLEPGESAPECLAREILEELSLRAEVGPRIDTYLFEIIPGKHEFESLVVGRVCQPLSMDSTRITLTPEMRRRYTSGHAQNLALVPGWSLPPAFAGAGAFRSTANDLLKLLRAAMGSEPSPLEAAFSEMMKVQRRSDRADTRVATGGSLPPRRPTGSFGRMALCPVTRAIWGIRPALGPGQSY